MFRVCQSRTCLSAPTNGSIRLPRVVVAMNRMSCQQIRCRWLLFAVSILSSSGLLYSQSPDDFNPGADYLIDTLALQPDGRILVGGSFGTVGGQICSALGRLNEDGSYDST